MRYDQSMATWLDPGLIGMSCAYAAILNACGLITSLFGSIVCHRLAPRERVRLLLGACIGMVAAQGILLVLQDVTGPDEGFPFWWLTAVCVQPIASGLGAVGGAWSIRQER